MIFQAERKASEWTYLAWIIGLSLAVKVALMVYVGDQMYNDVLRAVRVGQDVLEGRIDTQVPQILTKSVVGPVLWYSLFRAAGLWGLRLFNMAAFAGLLVVQFKMGREVFSKWVVLAGVFLVAFYPGSHRNVVVGEPDDMLASLLLATGVFVFLRYQRVGSAALLMGLAVVFKFWALIFVGGFLLELLFERRWRHFAIAAAVAAAPVLLVDLLTGGGTSGSFLLSVRHQQDYSAWPVIATKMITTGLLLSNVLAVWSYLRRPTRQRRLLLLLSAPYLLYVILMRDAFAASFVMMICLVFSSLLIADLWRDFRWSRQATVVVLVLYLVAGVGIAGLHLRRDSHEFVVRDRTTGQTSGQAQVGQERLIVA